MFTRSISKSVHKNSPACSSVLNAHIHIQLTSVGWRGRAEGRGRLERTAAQGCTETRSDSRKRACLPSGTAQHQGCLCDPCTNRLPLLRLARHRSSCQWMELATLLVACKGTTCCTRSSPRSTPRTHVSHRHCFALELRRTIRGWPQQPPQLRPRPPPTQRTQPSLTAPAVWDQYHLTRRLAIAAKSTTNSHKSNGSQKLKL
jgi:hypothetical protein